MTPTWPVLICLLFKFYTTVKSMEADCSCEYPFQPVIDYSNPKELWYCYPDNVSCPEQTTCEDLWLGLFVCCGYNTSQPNDTSDFPDPVKKKKNELRSLLLFKNGKHIRLLNAEETKSTTKEFPTPQDLTINESLDGPNRTINKFTTQIMLTNLTNHLNEITPNLINETKRSSSNISNHLENLILDFENSTRTTRLADFTKKHKDKVQGLKTANGFRKERIDDVPHKLPRNGSTKEITEIYSTPKIPNGAKNHAINHHKNASIAQVFILQEGLSRRVNATSYRFPATITLIVDHGKTVIVDTGMPTDYETLGLFLIELNRYGIEADAVDVVVTTHGHPDHFGHLNLFPSAIQIFGGLIYVGSTFTVSDLYLNEVAKLTENVSVYKTPGHTAEDLSVVVRNVTMLGTVSVVGDLFFSKEDINFPELWESQAWNSTLQNEYRHLLLCISDHIVPGHGAMFKVDKSMKKLFKCK